MIQNFIEMIVLVNGKPVSEYQHDDKIFIEGRGGSNYEIEIRNRSSVRIEALVSVDGLSVTDGKLAGLNSRGYLLNAGESIRIPGWKLDGQSAAKFAFSGKKDSYATYVAEGDSRNNGVIGVMAFAEQPRPIVNPLWYASIYNSSPPAPSYNTWSSTSNPSNLRSDSRSMSSSNISASASAEIYSQQSATMSANNIGSNAQWGAAVPQSLGTAFGDATAFATREVEFTRGAMTVTMSMYYDDRDGLRAKGVPIVRPRKRRVQPLPQAFPGIQQGCKPPENWRA